MTVTRYPQGASSLDGLGDVAVSSASRGQIIANNGTLFRNRSQGLYDVRDWGAVGDGSTDDATAIQGAIDAAATAKGGTVLLPSGRCGIGSTITLKEGVHLRADRGVDKASVANHIGSYLCWLPAAAGTMLQIGHKDQTVSVRNCTVRGLGFDGGNRSDVTAITLGSNTRTNADYVTTSILIEDFVITRCGLGIRWGTGETQEQVDGVTIRRGELNALVSGHPETSAHLRINGTNCGDFSLIEEVRFICGSSLAAGLAMVDMVFCGALRMLECFAGGEGTATRDWIAITGHNGLILDHCQSEKCRYEIWFKSGFSNDNVALELRTCYLDDAVKIDATARVLSHGSQIKAPLLLSGASCKWDGFGDTIVPGNGGQVVISGSGALYRNQRSKRASVNTVYATGSVLWDAPGGSGTIFEKVQDVVVRGGRKAAAWATNTAYTGAVDRSWVASTAYAVNDRVTPTWGNGRYYICTVAGTSGTTEPLWSSNATSAVYTDGSVTWTFGGSTAFSVSNTTYVEPRTPNDHVYKLITAGTSHASTEPTWPTTAGATVTDGTCTWQETGTSALIRAVPILFGDAGSAVPTTGYFYRGHLRWNNGPDPGEPPAWECTFSGTPGTWAAWAPMPRSVARTADTTIGAGDLITLSRKTSAAAHTLPATPLDHVPYTIKDARGDANVNNIVITSGGDLIDGAATYTINTAWGFVQLVHGDSKWSVVAKG